MAESIDFHACFCARKFDFYGHFQMFTCFALRSQRTLASILYIYTRIYDTKNEKNQ